MAARDTTAELERLGRRIKLVRKQRGMTQDGLAERAGLSPSSLAKIETGTRGMRVQTMLAIASALQVSAAEFFPDGRASSAREGRDGAARGRGASLADVDDELFELLEMARHLDREAVRLLMQSAKRFGRR